MPLVNRFDDYSPLANCTESISLLNRLACLFVSSQAKGLRSSARGAEWIGNPWLANMVDLL